MSRMGTCYSKSGHEIDPTMRDNRPKEKKGSSKNGHVKSRKTPTLIVEQVQMDVSDTVYTEDSHTLNALDIDNCINKSQQTSLDHLAKEAYRTPEVTKTEAEDIGHCNSVGKIHEDEVDDCCVNIIIEHPEVNDGQVVASDSGIVVEAGCEPVALHTNSIETSEHDMFSQNFESSLGELTHKADEDNVSHNQVVIAEKPFQHRETVQSQVISSLKQSSELTCHNGHSSNICCNGECQDCLFSSNSLSHGSFQPRVMKSSLKKIGAQKRRKKGLSWKSSDSLDWVDSMATSLDRTKSVCSSVLGDDISLLNAPLAAFDSVDFAIGDSYDFSKHFGGKLRNPVEYCSDSMQLKFDFSGLEGENRRSVSSLDRLSESHKNTDSSTDLDKIKLVLRQSSVSSSDQRFGPDQVDTSYELPAVPQQPEITTMTMNGREVVVIDADLFSQITDEIQFLKMKLSQLTEVIQETENTEISRPDRSTRLASLSSIS